MTDESSATLSIVPGKCIGSGNCVDVSPAYFDQDDDDATVILLQDRVPGTDVPGVERAVNVCPVAAILLSRG